MSKKKQTAAIEAFRQLRSKYNLSPAEFRYVCKMVRELDGLQIPKGRKSLPDFLNPAEIYHLLDISKEAHFDNLLIESLIKTGLRIQEANNLLVSDLDFGANQLKVRQGKGSKDRYVPMAHSLQRRLLTFLNGRTSGYVFCKPDGRKYSKRMLQLKVTKWLEKAAFSKKLSTHSLRHTFACACLARRVPIEKVKDLMGHSDIKVTQIYAKLETGAFKDDFLRLME